MDANLYEELKFDSIDAVDLLVQLKELTGERIAPEKFREVRTVGDVLNALTTL
jgi:acyl carrier protein